MHHPAARPDARYERDPLLDAFWEEGLILIGERVRQEYGLRTPIFIDLRHKLYDNLNVLWDLGRALHRKLIEIAGGETGAGRQQQVVGIPDTATPIALSTALASQQTALPVSYGQLRKKPASYPGGRSGVSAYMGTADPRREITLIDDVMASGRTKLWSIEQLSQDELQVKRILVVVDREQGGGEILEGHGYPVHSLYCISGIVEYYVSAGLVDPETGAATIDYLRKKQFRG